ncbi:hypothetical protein K2X33_12065 [bacterium]|nr:hypothetical protein [bacterium]
MGGFHFISAFALAFVLSVPTFAAKKAAGASCPKAVVTDLVSDAVLRNFAAASEIYSLEDLITNDPSRNLAVRFPSIVMDSYQIHWRAILHFGSKTIIEPTYRASNITAWNAFLRPTRSGVQVVGQYKAVNDLVGQIRDGASGAKSARKPILLAGPAGTGKTEALKVLWERLTELALYNPEFYDITFRWKDLWEVPMLRPLLDKETKDVPYRHQMGRSPIVLLPKRLQKAVTALANDKIFKEIGFPAHPFRQADPQTKQIIDYIIMHHHKGGPITERQYIDILSKHVEIVRNVPDIDRPAALLRAQGKDVEWSELFFKDNMFASGIFGPQNALSYFYTGKVLAADGKALLADEFFRNPQALRDVFLETAQNRVVDRGGPPAVYLNALIVTADNDESIEEAKSNGPSRAHINRSFKVPMRHTIHPTEASKVALLMVGSDRPELDDEEEEVTAPADAIAERFKMRPLKGPGKLAPANLEELYPAPNDKGLLTGPDGRYEIWYTPSDGQQILVAPRSLYLIGLTAAITRLVTDPKQLDIFKKELDALGSTSDEYTNPITRVRVILGELQTNKAIRKELERVRELLKEGQGGIMARNVESWLAVCLRMAAENENTLTPYVVDRAFYRLLDQGGFEPPTDAIRAEWVNLYEEVKTAFLLPRLAEDVQSIIKGESDGVLRLYEEIKREIIALNSNPDAKEYTQGDESRPINLERMRKIRKIYERINHRELLYGDITNFVVEVADSNDRHPGLMAAIETFLIEKELDTTALTGLVDYFEKGIAGGDVRTQAERARRELSRVGYNERAFMEALRLVRDLRLEQESRTRK